MSEVLRLNAVSKGYNHGLPGEISVLSGVDLSLRQGELVALVAPSGAGKSTLLHIAGLLDVPDSGEVAILGHNMGGLNDAQRTAVRRGGVGFVYQFHHLLPEFTALENVMMPQLANGLPFKEAEFRARALLKTVGVLDRALHRPAELSGGQQQRVALCRGLANAPALLLADEPTGNLDPVMAEQIFAALMTLVRETGLSALIATHNLELAARMDRVVRLNRGRVIEV